MYKILYLKNKMIKKAFTIVEILVVMVAMGTISASILPKIWSTREKTNETMTKVSQTKKIASNLGFNAFDNWDESNSSNSAWDDSNWYWYWNWSIDTQITDKPKISHNWNNITICGTEYVSNSNGAKWCITIMDRNLGASTAWEWTSAPHTSYGYYYQWWDNTAYGVVEKKRYIPKYGNNYLYSYYVIYRVSDGYGYWYRDENDPNHVYGYWYWQNIQFNLGSNYKSDNAWWWKNDNKLNNYWYPVKNPLERQWPCPNGYHVPSIWELNALMSMWDPECRAEYWMLCDVDWFSYKLQIPSAGWIDGNDNTDPTRARERGAALQSSSPRGSYRQYAWSPRQGETEQWKTNNALPIRCFKN